MCSGGLKKQLKGMAPSRRETLNLVVLLTGGGRDPRRDTPHPDLLLGTLGRGSVTLAGFVNASCKSLNSA